MVVVSRTGDSTAYFRSQDWRPAAGDLRAFTGTFASSEVHGEPFRLVVEGEQLVLRQSPTTRISLTPIYTDAFQAGGRVVWFTRDGAGRVTTMFIGQDRAWAVGFQLTAGS
jgi:YD repeat-containing protein